LRKENLILEQFRILEQKPAEYRMAHRIASQRISMFRVSKREYNTAFMLQRQHLYRVNLSTMARVCLCRAQVTDFMEL
jgi:hypothetical protein